MSKRITSSIAAVAATVAPIALVAVPTQAQALAATRISAVASDATPASGETFLLRGRFFEDGVPAAGQTVKVQTWREGAWVALKGARVTSTDEGRYRVRVVLSQKGDRQLRVVGVAEDGANARRTLTVTVH